MWVKNKKTGVLFEYDNSYYESHYSLVPDLEPCDAPNVDSGSKTRKELIAEAKKAGVRGADRMKVEDLIESVNGA